MSGAPPAPQYKQLGNIGNGLIGLLSDRVLPYPQALGTYIAGTGFAMFLVRPT